MSKPLPSPEEALDLLQAALSNARRLLDASTVLVEAGHAPPAYSLATLAFEEIGKAQMCILAMRRDPRSDTLPSFGPSGEGFWQAWGSHGPKIAFAQAFLTYAVRATESPGAGVAARLVDRARGENAQKMRGFYVDFDADGVHTPDEITEDQARQQIADVDAVLVFCERTWCGDDARAKALARLGRPAETYELDARVARAVEQDPSAAFQQAKSLFTAATAIE
jgi:AbiV family abortive infection protein